MEASKYCDDPLAPLPWRKLPSATADRSLAPVVSFVPASTEDGGGGFFAVEKMARNQPDDGVFGWVLLWLRSFCGGDENMVLLVRNNKASSNNKNKAADGREMIVKACTNKMAFVFLSFCVRNKRRLLAAAHPSARDGLNARSLRA